MIANNCVINTVTLQPNTNFVLPPGATIIGTSDKTALDSPCVDLTKVQEVACYVARLASYGNTVGSEYFKSYNQYLQGVYLNNQLIPFNGGDISSANETNYTFNMDVVMAKLKEIVPSISYTTYNTVLHANPDNNLTFLLIKALPSVAETLKISMFTNAPIGGIPDDGRAFYQISFVPYASVEGVAGVPACTSTNQ